MSDAHTSRRRRLVAATTLLVALGALATVGLVGLGRHESAGASTLPPGRIAVTGTGVASGNANELTLDIGVSNKADTATAALEENNTLTAKLVAIFVKAGVKKSGITTSDLELSPNYDSHQVITGYEVDDDLTVKTGDLAHAGSMIDAAARQVGNDIEIDGISFSLSNDSKVLAAARTAAMADARTEARALARAAHRSLGPVVKVTDTEEPAPSIEKVADEQATAYGAAAVPIEAGTQNRTVSVHVVYELLS